MKHVNHEDFFEYIENYAKENEESDLTEKTIYVIVNGDKVDEQEVEFLGIEEDFQGRDLLTFNYQGKKYTSYRIS
jgi:hypothetical protein